MHVNSPDFFKILRGYSRNKRYAAEVVFSAILVVIKYMHSKMDLMMIAMLILMLGMSGMGMMSMLMIMRITNMVTGLHNKLLIESTPSNACVETNL